MTTVTHCIGIGKAAWHASFTDGPSITGSHQTYDTTPEPPASCFSGQYTGALVYDARNVPDDVFVDHVYKGPMVDWHLPPNTVHELLDKPVPYTGQKLSALCSVSGDIFQARLRALPDIRIGRANRDKTVTWEEVMPTQ